MLRCLVALARRLLSLLLETVPMRWAVLVMMAESWENDRAIQPQDIAVTAYLAMEGLEGEREGGEEEGK